MLLQAQQVQLIQEWTEAREHLKKWSQLESDLRDRVIAETFDSSKTEGTETIELMGDWKLKAVRKLNYNLSNKDNALTNILASLPSVIAQNLIRWQPDLNLSMFRKLDQATQELFSPVLTIKPAKPSLELVPPTNANTVHQSN